MLFKPELVEKILKGEKTQTRRIAKLWEIYHKGFGWVMTDLYGGRLKWAIGSDYAVQPGRGKPGVARIRITDIRLEEVCQITEADARAEGFANCQAFIETFKRINPKASSDDDVWVLTFELVK